MALVVYFSYFAVFGNHGLLRWSKLEAAVEAKQAEFDRLREERVALQRRVSLMRPESVDADMLEEQARARLGLTEADEVDEGHPVATAFAAMNALVDRRCLGLP